MPERVQDNPLQRDLAKSKKSKHADRYLRPFFEKVAIQQYLVCCPKCLWPLFQESGAEYLWCECGASYRLVQVDIADEPDTY